MRSQIVVLLTQLEIVVDVVLVPELSSYGVPVPDVLVRELDVKGGVRRPEGAAVFCGELVRERLG